MNTLAILTKADVSAVVFWMDSINIANNSFLRSRLLDIHPFILDTPALLRTLKGLHFAILPKRAVKSSFCRVPPVKVRAQVDAQAAAWADAFFFLLL